MEMYISYMEMHILIYSNVFTVPIFIIQADNNKIE